MTSRIVALCFDADDPQRLAAFWAEALRWEVEDRDGEAWLVPTDGTAIPLRFQPGASANVEPPRAHFDLTSSSLEDQAGSVEQLLGLGARHLDVGQLPEDTHVVLADPEGNPLCVIEPQNNFLAGCARLGSMSCDGGREIGVFWSEVLGWPLVWDQDDETAIRAPGDLGPLITWGGVAKPKTVVNRLHLDLAAADPAGHDTEVERLVALGATRLGDDPGCAGAVLLADPDGNEFRLLPTP